jgi:hypothetical protein
MTTFTPLYPETTNDETCDVHGRPARKAYDFGMGDAEVVVFACGCAACFPTVGFNDPGTLYPDYATAAGRARMIAARASSR